MKKFGLVLILVGYCANAHAYVDPGSGLLIIQGFLALVGGVIMFFKNPIQATKAFISRFKKEK